jgi:succinyl-diaminopimelate desuccinylase
MKPRGAAGCVQLDRLVDTTVGLVQFDTQNPPGRERSVVPWLTSLLTSLGCAVDVFHSPTGRPSVLATYGNSSADRPTLLINGHIDVVPVVEADWTSPPFVPTERDGRLYGRGTADMKGGIAAAIEGLRACIDAGSEFRSTIVFHLVADEETGGVDGTEALLEAGRVQADACIIPEPTELKVSIAERGSYQADVEVHGRSGHGSDPAKGRSAIADAARMITALHLAPFHATGHPLLGSPTCNVSLVHGGLASNVIAPSCEFTIDRRTLPGETADEVLDSIARIIDVSVPDADYRVNQTVFVEASEMSDSHPFPKFVARAASTDELPAELVGLLLATDGRFLRNELGIPTVVYGPGSIRQAHTADEWVDIEQLQRAAVTFARVFEEFAG